MKKKRKIEPQLAPPEKVGYINPVPRLGATPVSIRPIPGREAVIRNYQTLRDTQKEQNNNQ